MFELAAPTSIDGKPSFCGDASGCTSLPKRLVIGESRVAILYWNTNPDLVGAAVRSAPGSGRYGSDMIFSILK